MDYRFLTALDADRYQSLRLEGIKNTPEAFGSSYEEEKDTPIDLIAKQLEDSNVYTMGAFEENKLFGIATLWLEEKLKLKHKANIFAVYVSPEKRGLGVGKKLIQEIINKARTLDGVEQINLSVVSTNNAAKQLYISLGFTVFGTEKSALKVGLEYFDEEYMVLFLK